MGVKTIHSNSRIITSPGEIIIINFYPDAHACIKASWTKESPEDFVINCIKSYIALNPEVGGEDSSFYFQVKTKSYEKMVTIVCSNFGDRIQIVVGTNKDAEEHDPLLLEIIKSFGLKINN